MLKAIFWYFCCSERFPHSQVLCSTLEWPVLQFPMGLREDLLIKRPSCHFISFRRETAPGRFFEFEIRISHHFVVSTTISMSREIRHDCGTAPKETTTIMPYWSDQINPAYLLQSPIVDMLLAKLLFPLVIQESRIMSKHYMCLKNLVQVCHLWWGPVKKATGSEKV